VIVLDDGGRDAVRDLATSYGFRYLTRPDRGRMKKAGNLAFGAAHSDGDLVLVLDADFCPAPDTLRELAPYFDDPAVGIVQSPQYFDSWSPRTWLERGAGAVQELFYRWVQPSRDGVGAAICVGTNALYRRTALDAAGGFAQIGHSEDVHTGVAVLKRGYDLRYVPVLLARGLCPDGVGGFVSQQYRWCSGSMSLLADRGFHNAGLPLRVRLCFWTGFLYYITTGVTVFTGFAAALVMLWVLPEQISPVHYLPLVAAVWGMFFQWRRVSHGRYDLSILRVRLLYSVAHALAVWHALTGRTQDHLQPALLARPPDIGWLAAAGGFIQVPLESCGAIRLFGRLVRDHHRRVNYASFQRR
jgi:cellulose synthase (UDP-forming)